MKTILHILCDLNGKITGPMFSSPAIGAALRVYSKIRNELSCEAVVYGRVTMEEGYSDGLWKGDHKKALRNFADFQASTDVRNYIVSLDPLGTLAFDTGLIIQKNRPAAHVIQVLSGQVSREYLEYLQDRGISWIYGGKDSIDLKMVLEKLEKDWHIDRLMIAGGGCCDWSFARNNLLDEISLVIAPIISAGKDCVSVFEPIGIEPDRSLFVELVDNRVMEKNVMWLHYRAVRH